MNTKQTTISTSKEEMFNVDLVQLFDRYDLHPTRIAVHLLWWANEIMGALGEDVQGTLKTTQEFMDQINGMTSSTMAITTDPDTGRRLRTVAYARERELWDFPVWRRLNDFISHGTDSGDEGVGIDAGDVDQ